MRGAFFVDLFYLGIACTKASVSWTATIAKSYCAFIIEPGTIVVHGVVANIWRDTDPLVRYSDAFIVTIGGLALRAST